MKWYKTLIFLSAIITSSLSAGEGAKISYQDSYDQAFSAFQKKKWKEVIQYGKNVLEEESDSPFAADLCFLTGVAYFNQKDYDIANTYFSTFLEKHATPKYFEEAVIYKFQIAENYEEGRGKHIMGFKALPRLASGWDDAYQIYDEVIHTLSRHEVAAKALFQKAGMLRKDKKFPESIETYQTLIRRFPKHPLAPESYLAVGAIYLEETKEFFTDKDFLEQARLNLKKFKQDFPREERTLVGETMLKEMMDRYAKDLWDSAVYYQKKKKLPAAHLYYQSILKKYPESHFAEFAVERLGEMHKSHPELIESIATLEE